MRAHSDLRSLGTPLPWSDVKNHVGHVKEHGIIQLLNTFKRFSNRVNDPLVWGDELEYMVVKFDNESKKAILSLRQDEILDKLMELEKGGKLEALNVSYHQEYGRYMIEATPGRPYTHKFSDLTRVEKNMNCRRKIAKSNMSSDDFPLTITTFPLMGVGKFTDPYQKPEGSVSRSFFLPDNIINTHARFPTLTSNIRERRGEKVSINVPLYRDVNTPWPFKDPTIPWDRDIYPEDANAKEGAALPNHIYMDSMGFGMGCCCLQLTFQASCMDEARNLYDQLAPLTPVMLALSAAAPIYRGYLSDQDVRWNVIRSAVDDRNRAERGLTSSLPSQTTNSNSSQTIPKSRYDSIDCFIGTSPILTSNCDVYNDIDIVVNEHVKKRLIQGNMDPLLAQHFSHLFIRDPLVIFEELLDQDDETSMDHFENIQSTNWQTLRFKPPSSEQVGWRVEFRSMDVQLTDFENAAFSVFIVLLSRVILSYDICLYLPMSLIDANMSIAHKRNAVHEEKFWFRANMKNQSPESDGNFSQFSINDIINGNKEFTGLIPLLRDYLASMDVEMDVLCELERYISFISLRASGSLETAATWIRNYVKTHPSYKHDSVIPEDLNYDLLKIINELADSRTWETLAPSLLGGFSGVP